MAEIGRIGENRRQDRTRLIRCAPALQVRKTPAEPGPPIHFGKEIGDTDRRQMRIEGRKCGFRFLGRNRLERRNPQPARAELYILERVHFRFARDFCQSSGKTFAPLGQPSGGGIWCRDRQRTCARMAAKTGPGISCCSTAR